MSNEGSTPLLGDAQPGDTLKCVRDRTVLATLLYHGIRREELCPRRLKDLQSREGVMPFRIHGRCGKIRFVPVHPMALRLIDEYLQMGNTAAEEHKSLDEPLFSPVKNSGR